MNQSPYFSIIVALYNKEKFLERGLKSIFNQSFSNYELVLVDDGSTDTTPVLCDEKARENIKLKVIHQNNQGPGSARNTGIDNSSGKYLCFFDIDDTVEDNWLQNVFDEIKEINPDVLISGYTEINPKYRINTHFNFDKKYLKNRDDIKNNFKKELSGMSFNNGFVWNKIYKREFITKHKIYFPNHSIQQDEIFNHNVYKFNPTILITDKIFYNYFVYYEGNNRSKFIPNRIKIFEDVKRSYFTLISKLGIDDDNLIKFVHKRFLNNVFFNRNPKESLKDKIYIYKSILNNDQIKESISYLKNKQKNTKNIHEYNFKLFCFAINLNSVFFLYVVDTISKTLSSLNKKLK